MFLSDEPGAPAGVLSGFLNPAYARSFVGSGSPIELSDCGGWLLRRPIPGSAWSDAMGPYPLFCCRRWSALARDLERLSGELVSVVLVADPLGEYDRELLEDAFDYVRAYKRHFVIDTSAPLESFASATHRSHARRALTRVEVEVCADPVSHLDDCERLLSLLADRRGIDGIRRLSRPALREQLGVPGTVLFRAEAEGSTVGFESWYLQGNCAQGHLAAYDDLGHELHASYATKWRAIEYLRTRALVLNLGAGLTESGSDGLATFKRGWASSTRIAWLCGRVLDHEKFDRLSPATFDPKNDYFPPYRRGELSDSLRSSIDQGGPQLGSNSP